MYLYIYVKVSIHTVEWNLFATEFFCEYLQIFEIAKSMIAKNFDAYIVIIVMMNFLCYQAPTLFSLQCASA